MPFSNDWTIPTNALFFERHRRFANVPASHIDLLIDECVDHVGGLDAVERWRDEDYQSAIMYLVAHLLVQEGEPDISNAAAAPASGAGGVPTPSAGSNGPVEKVKVGDVEIQYDTARSGTAGIGSTALSGMGEDRMNFSLTHYGRMFMRLREKNFGGPRVFVPGG